MKSDWFFFPLGPIFRALGGIPVNRKERTQTVERLQEQLRQKGQIHLAITPEGTRSRGEKWKSGFYHIAVAAGLPIELAVIDYGKKELGIFEVFYPTGDIEQDLAPRSCCEERSHHLPRDDYHGLLKRSSEAC